MLKELIRSEEDIYKLFDRFDSLIKDSDLYKAKYLDHNERYFYQKTFDFPKEYPCIFVYNLMRDNHSSIKEHLNNKTYYKISEIQIVYLSDFDRNK